MKKAFLIVLMLLTSTVLMGADGCMSQQAQSTSGAVKAEVRVPLDQNGLTAEQRAVANRILEDNKPGSIKHLYVISAYSGQVIIYSTVQGKVTSGGKRLTPTTVAVQRGTSADGFAINFGVNNTQYTGEVLQDDGTYGHSGDYLFWWDTKGVYHQHYVSGGQILHISNHPLAVKSIIINMSAKGGSE
jgi:hypothetical protein